MSLNTSSLLSEATKFLTKIGGDDGVMGVSGTLTISSFDKILEFMDLAEDDIVFDFGFGGGSFLFQATSKAFDLGIEIKTCGVEFDEIKAIKAKAVKKHIMKMGFEFDMDLRMQDIEKITCINATKVLASWEGMPPETKKCIAKLINTCTNVKKFVFIERYRRRDMSEILLDRGFTKFMTLTNTESVVLAGGRTKLHAYCYEIVN